MRSTTRNWLALLLTALSLIGPLSRPVAAESPSFPDSLVPDQAAPRPAPANPIFPFVASVFTDNMVLQCDQSDAIWGWTIPGEVVTMTFRGPTDMPAATAIADVNGKWTVQIGPVPAGGPYEITASGSQTQTFSNVLFGDVWICGGQSNMEFGVTRVLNADREIKKANWPQIRLFTVAEAYAPNQRSSTRGFWQVCSPDALRAQGNSGGFSAVGYFFGRVLQHKLGVPIGLIQVAWGGTPIQAWMSRGALEGGFPQYAVLLDQLTARHTEPLAQRQNDWYQSQDEGTQGEWQLPTQGGGEWDQIAVPGFYQDAGIPEIAKGNNVIWYRQTFDLPDEDLGESGVLHCVVNDVDTVWINGTLVGSTQTSGTERAYPVPAALLKASGNILVIRDVNNAGKGGIIGDPASLRLEVQYGTDVPLAGIWSWRLGCPVDPAFPFPMDPVLSPDYPSLLFNGMVNPLVHFGIKGVIWYQGEANATEATEYQRLLSSLIVDWRSHWGQGDFPFLIVQLAGWEPGGPDWAVLRQAQWATAQTMPNAGIATAVDLGDPDDLHPRNKQDVAHRLALVALDQVYGQKVESSGPVFKGATVEGDAIRVSFTHLGGGLVTKGKDGLTGFEIAGADGHFVPARASIDGETVVVSSDEVSAPASVRYAWSGYPLCSLYNAAGLPAFPFNSAD